jgi:hypothetical protein
MRTGLRCATTTHGVGGEENEGYDSLEVDRCAYDERARKGQGEHTHNMNTFLAQILGRNGSPWPVCGARYVGATPLDTAPICSDTLERIPSVLVGPLVSLRAMTRSALLTTHTRFHAAKQSERHL